MLTIERYTIWNNSETAAHNIFMLSNFFNKTLSGEIWLRKYYKVVPLERHLNDESYFTFHRVKYDWWYMKVEV